MYLLFFSLMLIRAFGINDLMSTKINLAMNAFVIGIVTLDLSKINEISMHLVSKVNLSNNIFVERTTWQLNFFFE